MIQSVVRNDLNHVYVFTVNEVPYISIVESSADWPWLVMFDQHGMMETAFIVENPQSYLSKPEFRRIGSVEEVLKHDKHN